LAFHKQVLTALAGQKNSAAFNLITLLAQIYDDL